MLTMRGWVARSAVCPSAELAATKQMLRNDDASAEATRDVIRVRFAPNQLIFIKKCITHAQSKSARNAGANPLIAYDFVRECSSRQSGQQPPNRVGGGVAMPAVRSSSRPEFGRRLGAGMDVQLVIDIFQMPADGLDADAQFVGDFLV